MSTNILWQDLENQLSDMVESFPGVAGICVRSLDKTHDIQINANEVFPTASTIKIHILTRLLYRAERGELDMKQKFHITPDMKVVGSGILAHLDDDIEMSLENLAILMITISDNTATNMCIDLAGINDTNLLLRQMGLTQTTLRRKMQDPESISKSKENVATPAECVSMLECLSENLPSKKVATRCLQILKKPNAGPLKRVVPPTITVASKPGGMEKVQCDAGIVFLPRFPYAVAIMSKFGMLDSLDHTDYILDIAQLIFDTAKTINDSNEFGLGIS